MESITVKNVDAIAPYGVRAGIAGIRFRPAREALGVSSWGMSVLELDAHCSAYPEHDHASDGHEEVYLVLRGSVVLQADGVEQTLAQGDLVRVDGAVKRKLLTREEGATLLALGGTPGKVYAPSMGG